MAKLFYTYTDVMEILSISKSTAYKVINKLNCELKLKGKEVKSGRVNVQYFNKRYTADDLDDLDDEVA